MSVSWKGQDYRFSSLISLGMLISFFIIAKLAPTTMELVSWAPIGGIFSCFGMARLQRRGSIALMILPLVLVFTIMAIALRSTVFGLFGFYLGIATALAEAVVFWFGNYKIKRNRFLGNLVFFTSSFIVGVVSAAWIIGDEFAKLLAQPWQFAGLILATAVTASIGWWLGEFFLSKLKRADT